MIYRVVCCFFLSLSAFSQETVVMDNALRAPMQKSWMLLQSAGQFHSAKIEDELSFEIKASEQNVSFDGSYLLGVKNVSDFRMRTMHAAIDIPIHLQVGFSVTLPTYTLYNFDTEFTGYFVKFQVDQWLFDFLPNMAFHVSQSELSIGKFFDNSITSSSFVVSESFWFLEGFASYTMNQASSTWLTENGDFSADRTEVFPTIGLSASSTFFTLTAESIFLDGITHYGLSFSLKF